MIERYARENTRDGVKYEHQLLHAVFEILDTVFGELWARRSLKMTSQEPQCDDVIEIRHEKPGDADAVREVNRQAFRQDDEARIVDALRANGAVTLSLVAVDHHSIVGHILFSPVSVGNLVGAALGPMAVVPRRQRRGIGTRLVEAGIERLRATGCPFVVVIGHPNFYPRFGFEPAVARRLTCEWDVPAEAFMVRILDPEVRGRLEGLARYRAEFSTLG